MAGNGTDYRLLIRIGGELERSLLESTDLTRRQINQIVRHASQAASQTNVLQRGLQQTAPFFNSMSSVAAKAFRAVTAAAKVAGIAVAGIGFAATQAGIEFESAFAGVKKTTDATAEEYAILRQEIVAMTREIPATASEIAKVAEVAGQLGIEKENLLDFSRVMIDMGESTNLVAEEAASALAKFVNITGMAPEHYEKLGSVVVDLGNNFATTEADIVEMATRLAASGELAGFTEAQIMAMAASMSSVGIEAEAGGSAMSKMIKKVQVAIETNKASVADYAQVAGKSVAQFKEDFEKDGLSAVSSFIAGLNDIERHGKSATVILDELGLTEIRLSNTLLSLANADELMFEAVEMANKAWEDGTALAIEAGRRYETTESQINLLKNGLTEMGIAMYDQFNAPLREGVSTLTDFVHQATADISGSNVIRDLAYDSIEKIPSIIRIVQETAVAFGNLAAPFLGIGEWLIDNPKVVSSAIVGIGTALTTYKVAKKVMDLYTALSSLTLASVPILGVAAGITALVGAITYFAQIDNELTQANLASHFGDITLSMEELEAVADHIVSTNNMGKLQESIQALGELEGIDRSINDALSEINKMNWKVSLRMELSEDEQEQYKKSIDTYAQDVQSYIEQEQYAVSLAIGVLTGDDLENSNIVRQLNEFYAGKSGELEEVGKKLNNAVTSAFQDGLLSIPEVHTISEWQKSMAKIKASLAMGNYESNLELLSIKYGDLGEKLDAETFQNIMAEIEVAQADAKQQYDEAYVATSRAEKAMLEQGTITKIEYDANMRQIEQDYLEQIGELNTKAANFVSGTILKQYGAEIGDKTKDFDQKIAVAVEENIQASQHPGTAGGAWDSGNIAYSTGIEKLNGRSGKALAELWTEAKGIYNFLTVTTQRYMESGKELPDELRNAVMQMSSVGMLSGDHDSVYDAMAVSLYENKEYRDSVREVSEYDTYLSIPEQFDVALDRDTAMKESVQALYDSTDFELRKIYAQGFKVETILDLKLTGRPYIGTMSPVQLPEAQIPNFQSFSKESSVGGIAHAVGYRSRGGIVTQPELSWIAEAGYSESVIPLDGSAHAVSLWKQTGELLGVSQKSPFRQAADNLISGTGGNQATSDTTNYSNDSRSIVFNPTIQISGEANKKDVENALDIAFERFEEMMERYGRNRERYAY